MLNRTITVTGDLGSGKSLLVSGLAESLGAEVVSTGHVQRQLAEELGMTTLELNEHARTHPEIDHHIDGRLKSLGGRTSSSYLVVDSRMAWHLVRPSYRVCLVVDPSVAAQRVLSAGRDAEGYRDVNQAIADLAARKRSENERFLSLYGVDCADFSNFDLVIDTSCLTPSEVREEVLAAVHDAARERATLLAPKRLLPTQAVTELYAPQVDALSRLISTGGWSALDPIVVAEWESYWYVLDGHNRVSAALRSGLGAVATVLATAANTPRLFGMHIGDFLRREFRLSAAYDWEDVHSFRFSTYPGKNLAEEE